MAHLDHTKIGKNKKRLNTISIGLIAEGIIIVIFFASLDFWMWWFQIPHRSGINGIQWLGILYGIGRGIMGWRVRK